MVGSTGYLLDTTVLILYSRGTSAAQEIENRFHFTDSAFKPIVSVVTIGEIHAFAAWHKWGEERIKQLSKLVSNLVVLDISRPEIIKSYADISAYCLSNGRKPGNNDTWIAATARVTGATLLTSDRDFDPLDPLFLNRVLIDPKAGTVM